MAAPVSLLDMLLTLLNDPAAKAAFVDDPKGFLADCGLDHLTADDVHDAIVLAADNEPHEYARHQHGQTEAAHLTPAPPVTHHHGEDAHDQAVRYLNNYITNNYLDARQTNIDNSFHQHVDTDGGDFDQRLDLHPTNATGDGAVAIGGDNHGPITTGDHNVVGDHNNTVDGNNDTTGFGRGDVSSLTGVTADHGSAVSGTGTATGSDTDSHNELNNFGKGAINTADHGSTATQTTSDTHTDSHDDSSTHTDNHSLTDSHDSSETASHNDTAVDSHDHTELASHNTDTTDSHDTLHVLSDNSHFHV
ncbi:IniB N-terminal domain-containing protein [Pseudonocardia hispaniensis]|uniref:IniB N-terminal domain-containing protein n=1 Tax=Pseudonocardia hispaniensis TaxID=904933 RepID=A0ABW1J068_9PSEU